MRDMNRYDDDKEPDAVNLDHCIAASDNDKDQDYDDN